jgi:hypothetical protein
VPVSDGFHDPNGGHVSAGTTIPCLLCGGEAIYDPAYVQWHCTLGRDIRDCRHESEKEPAGAHSSCGYRVMLSLDLAGTP